MSEASPSKRPGEGAHQPVAKRQYVAPMGWATVGFANQQEIDPYIKRDKPLWKCYRHLLEVVRSIDVIKPDCSQDLIPDVIASIHANRRRDSCTATYFRALLRLLQMVVAPNILGYLLRHFKITYSSGTLLWSSVYLTAHRTHTAMLIAHEVPCYTLLYNSCSQQRKTSEQMLCFGYDRIATFSAMEGLYQPTSIMSKHFSQLYTYDPRVWYHIDAFVTRASSRKIYTRSRSIVDRACIKFIKANPRLNFGAVVAQHENDPTDSSSSDSDDDESE